MPFIRSFFLSALVALTVSGCDVFKSNEDQCLQSSRLSFSDPDSLKVVENLGDRGQVDMTSGKGFWLRYSTANLYGGRISGNIACEQRDRKWIRSKPLENMAVEGIERSMYVKALKETADKMQQLNNEFDACKTNQCRDENAAIGNRMGYSNPQLQALNARQKAKAEAQQIVFENVGNLRD